MDYASRHSNLRALSRVLYVTAYPRPDREEPRSTVRRTTALLVLASALAVAGCQSGAGTSGALRQTMPRQAQAANQAGKASVSLAMAVQPAPRAVNVRPDHHVTVSATGGSLSSVVVSRGGTVVAGRMTPDSTAWRSSQRLSTGTTYTVTAVGVARDGTTKTLTSTFTTLTPKTTSSVYVTPSGGSVVGVGMPVIVTFGRSVHNRDAAIQALAVTSTPPVLGGWRWFSSRQVQWRPVHYWPAGTKVSVRADLSGVELSPGVWGRSSTTRTFAVGSAMVSTVNIRTHTMTVTRNGKVIRTIPITTGKPGWETRNGIKVLITREPTRRMDAATSGIPKNSPNYYNVVVQYAMRLTWSGEFIHAAPWSVGSQGHANVSHGCTGMSTAHAAWFFANSKIGDVVVYTGGHRAMEWGNGYTAWNMSFDRWSSAV